MKIYSDPFNFLCIKIVFTSEVAGTSVDFVNSIENVGPKKFPILKIQSGDYIFSTNSICRYILAKNTKEEINIQTEEWVNWESTLLSPFVINVLQAALSGSKIADDLKKNLKSSLSFLDKYLITNPSLPGNGVKPGLADIVIWSTIYLLYGDNKLQKEFLSEYEALTKWFLAVSECNAAQKAISCVLNGKDYSVLKTILLAVSIPLPLSKVHSSPIKVQASSAVLQDDETEVDETAVTADEVLSAVESFTSGLKPEDCRKAVPCPVLPIKGERNCLITSALPYVNNVPHLGNMIGAVLSADVYARYCRLRQYNVIYICGTDEYGTATENKAIEEKTTPLEICNKYNKLHKEVYDWFECQFDYFGRTCTENQTRICQDIFWKLHQNGYISKDTTEQLHCNQCSRFLADRFVEGICPFCAHGDARGDQCDKCQKLINPIELIDPKCKVCSATPQIKSSEHLYLDLPQLQPLVKEWLDKITPDSHWSTTAKVISYAWLKEGLKPRCITRDLKWGTPVPLEGFTNKVFYVWFDAPIGYPSMTNTYTPHWEKWWKNPDDVQLYQFMAKDNVAFHGIIFPASCIGTKDNYTLVNHLAAVEYLNYEDTKFSKSRGTGVFGNDAQNTGIPADIFRFYLLYIRPENQDTAFSWVDLMTKNNSELLNNLGNYINRASTFVFNNFGGKIPDVFLNEDDKIFVARIARELTRYISTMENIKLRDGVRIFLNISKMGNQHIQANKPWELIKGTDEQKLRAGTVMGLSVNIACLLSLLMDPYMPKVAQELRDQLNFPCEKKVLTPYFYKILAPGHPINKPIPLFKKIEQPEVDELKRVYAGKQASPERQTEKKSPSKKSPEKSVTVPQVNGSNSTPSEMDQGSPKIESNPAEIQAMTVLVTQQGDKVRQLKSQKAAKMNIDAEVAILLNLKKKLLELSGEILAVKPTQEKKKKGKK